jgi:outer membrane receptor protein involved in Fe transport
VLKLFSRSILSAAFVLSIASGPVVHAEQMVIEEVIVTAQKREQSIQDVPISISAFDQQFLDDAGIDDVLELQFFVPGLTILNNQTPAQTNINIRGVGTAGNSLSMESSVGLYIDGVYRSRQSSSIGDLVDVERVEVLKGPQGTLFGKNTASGALQILTVAPDLDSRDGFFEVQGGSENYRNFKGAISVPLIEGTSAIRISGSRTERDGYMENLTTGTDLNDRDRYSLRGQFAFDNGEGFTARIIADISEIDEKCCAATNIFDGPGDTIAGFLGAGGTLPPAGNLPGASYLLPLEFMASAVGFSGTPVVLADRYDDDVVAQNIDPYAEIKETGLSAEFNWEVSETMTLTSVTAFRAYDADDFNDADFNSLDILSLSGGTTEQDTFSQEFRIAGTYGERTNYVAGAYYFDQEIDRQNLLGLGTAANLLLTGGLPTSFLVGGAAACPLVGINDAVCNGPAFPAGEFSENLSTQEQKSWAVFAQADFDISEQLVLTAGIRYLDEEKDMNVTFNESIFSPVWAAFTPLSPLVPNVDNETFGDTALTGTLKLSYFMTDQVMGYVSWGRGYKSGGTNIDRISPATGAPLLFDAETSDSLEVGLKGDFFDKRLRINASAYQTDFEDFQENTFVGTGFVLQNAGEIQTRGFEMDAQALISSWLSIAGGVAHVDAEYDSFVGGPCIRTPFGAEPDANEPNFPTVCDVSGNRVGSTPEWSYYASLISERQMGEGFLYGRFDYNWRDDMFIGADNDLNKVADSSGVANVKLGYRFNDDRYDVAIWAKNAFDEDHRTSAFNSVIREGSLSAYHLEPRTVGITLRASVQ